MSRSRFNSLRRPKSLLLVALVAGLSLWVGALGRSVAQLRALVPVENETGHRGGASASDFESARAIQIEAATPLDAEPDALEPEDEVEPELPARSGPVGGAEFARLLDGELQGEADSEAAAEFLRALNESEAALLDEAEHD
jgi:hypothetical protein